MSNKRPDELPVVSSVAPGDILIAEINPDDGATRRVVKITKENLLQGIAGGGGSSFTGELISMSGCTLYASGEQVGINTCEPSAGYSLHVSGDTLASGNLDVQGNLVLQGNINSASQKVGQHFSAVVSSNMVSGNIITGNIGRIGLGGLAMSGPLVQHGTATFYNSVTLSDSLSVTNPLGSPGVFHVETGVYLPNLTTSQRDGLDLYREGSGAIIFNSDSEQFQGYNGTEWVNLGGGSGSGITGVESLGAGSALASGVSGSDLYLKSLVGGTNVTLSSDDNTVTINAAGGGGGGAGGTFAFFSNAINNNGIIEKTYYPTVDPNIYLSGIDVDNASDITLYLRWDGPGDGYMGTGFIHGQQIPTGNISQLGTSTRRFEGYIAGLDLAGETFVTGTANGSTGIISLQEAGAGPTPFSVFIPPVSSGTPKAGTNLGSLDYKGGDTTTGYVTFDTSDVTGIKVFDYGASEEIDYTSYTLVDTGDGRYTARIPLTIRDLVNGDQNIKVIAVNNFGTTGAATESNDVPLDQTYPVITATDPALSAYANSQGLTSGESVNFTNSIANWDSANGDTVLYSGLNNQISITNSGTFENPKSVTYVTGVYNISDNITITAARDDNGAVDSENVAIRIAKNPIITGLLLDPYAISATAPNIVGVSEIKGGDVAMAAAYVNTNEVDPDDIEFSIANAGVSDGSQTSYASAASHVALPDGSSVFELHIDVSSLRSGPQSVTATVQNNFGTTGNTLTSAANATLNQTVPSFSFGTIEYPVGQAALRDSQTGGFYVTNTGDYDTILYTSPNGQITVSNPNDNDEFKVFERVGGGYNISANNVKAELEKSSNGMVNEVYTVLNIAHTPASFTINGLESNIQIDTGNSVSDNFDLDIDQVLYEIPELYLDYTQDPQSTLTALSQGTGTTDNDYQLTVAPDDAKGTFTFSGSGLNLAGRETFVIGTRPNYIISGIVEGSGYIHPLSPCAGLIYLQGPMIDPATMLVENVAKAGGGGANNGTDYTYQAYADGTNITCATDIVDKFAIVTSGAGPGIGVLTTSTTGDYLFNLDMTQRLANTAGAGALFVISQP